MDAPLSDEDGGEEAHHCGDPSEAAQDAGQQAEDGAEKEESPPGTSPPQVPPKVLTQLSVGDGEGGRLHAVGGACGGSGAKQVLSVLGRGDHQELHGNHGKLEEL